LHTKAVMRGSKPGTDAEEPLMDADERGSELTTAPIDYPSRSFGFNHPRHENSLIRFKP
jgi:hypothetical protein